MKKEERDIFDDLVRSKLQQFEADTTPDDWEAIAGRLPHKAIPLRRRWPYWAAAAVVSLMLISTGIYIYQSESLKHIPVIAEQTEFKQQEKQEQPAKPAKPELLATATPPVAAKAEKADKVIKDFNNLNETLKGKTAELATHPLPPLERGKETLKPREAANREAQTPQTPKQRSANPAKRWNFGAGAGGFTGSSGDVVNTYALRSSTFIDDERLMVLNAAADDNKEKKTNIKHKTPVSFGLGVSYSLNNRFAIQTGLNYTMLTSDWETQGSAYNNKTRQRLHFLGLPLSLSYKIAEWNRFSFYASAGVQTEINVAGKERVRSYLETPGIEGAELVESYTNKVRMKEWQWSAGVRAGVSYPIIRYVSAFAEVGAVYYFDNGSKMETIYSDKQFNVNPQFGLRLNF